MSDFGWFALILLVLSLSCAIGGTGQANSQAHSTAQICQSSPANCQAAIAAFKN